MGDPPEPAGGDRGDGGVPREAAEGFSRTADDYERSRPSYPQAAVDHLAAILGLGPGRTVVDLGAGTGKLTRLLVPTGARVVAVEPLEAMREQLVASSEGAEVLEGTAEHLPLAGRSVHAVTVAQAFHWFDGDATLAELRRVLVPEGGVAVVYNERDRSVPWVAEVDAIVDEHRGERSRHWDGRWQEAFDRSDEFTPLEQTAFDNPQLISPADLVGRYRSISHIGALDAHEQGAVLAAIAGVLARHPDTSGRTTLEVPQQCVVWFSRRR